MVVGVAFERHRVILLIVEHDRRVPDSGRRDRVQPSLSTRVAIRRDRDSLASRNGAGRSDCITHADLLRFYARTDRIGPGFADGYGECHDVRVE